MGWGKCSLCRDEGIVFARKKKEVEGNETDTDFLFLCSCRSGDNRAPHKKYPRWNGEIGKRYSINPHGLLEAPKPKPNGVKPSYYDPKEFELDPEPVPNLSVSDLPLNGFHGPISREPGEDDE